MSMFKHILAATDGSDISSNAIAMAARLAHTMGARLTVLNTREPFVDWSGYAPMVISPEAFEKATQAASREILEDARRLAKGEGADCDTVCVVSNTPWRSILDCAKTQDCDAIVMASHGRRGIEGVMMGSETQKVLTHSTVPVLVTR